jgi:hypothetical protein
MYMRKNLPTLGCMGLKESPSFFPILFVMDIFLLISIDNINPGLTYLTRKGSICLYPLLSMVLLLQECNKSQRDLVIITLTPTEKIPRKRNKCIMIIWSHMSC